MSENRDRGIEFGDLEDDLAAEDYPMTTEEVLEKYGDREVEHSRGTMTLGDMLEGVGQSEYESEDELHEELLNMVGSQAVGDEEYTDRGTSTAGTDETKSF